MKREKGRPENSDKNQEICAKLVAKCAPYVEKSLAYEVGRPVLHGNFHAEE
jgi:hypothetical protein